MNERGYHSPLRAELYAATRARIVRAAAAERGAPVFAEVARRAGVSERTVYRHFPTVAALEEARVQQLEADAGWPAGDVEAAALPELTRRAFAAFARHRGPAPAESAEVREARAARKRQLAAALRPVTRTLSRERAQAAAALVGLVSSGEAYRQLVDAWGLDGKVAGQAAAWAVEMLLAELGRAAKKPKPSTGTGGGRHARGRRA